MIHIEVNLIEYPTDKDWMEVKRRALVTIGKEPVNPPTEEWKQRIITAQHSPIRYLRFSFYLKDIPSWVATHLVRHIHAQPYVKSQRNDRQANYDRNSAPQNAPVDMIWDMNAEELITIAHKRLCMQASPETRQVVKLMCQEVNKVAPYMQNMLVPMCEFEHCCREMFPCGYWDKIQNNKKEG